MFYRAKIYQSGVICTSTIKMELTLPFSAEGLCITTTLAGKA
jgi:hypothetical protein